jgi:hypothetical protein
MESAKDAGPLPGIVLQSATKDPGDPGGGLRLRFTGSRTNPKRSGLTSGRMTTEAMEIWFGGGGTHG